jgi:hypothetical protein
LLFAQYRAERAGEVISLACLYCSHALMVSLHHKDRKCAAYSLQPHTVSLHRKDILRSFVVRFGVSHFLTLSCRHFA